MKSYLIALLCCQAAWSGAAMADTNLCRMSIGDLATAVRTLSPHGASDQQTLQASLAYYRAEASCRGEPLSEADRGILTMAAHKLGRTTTTMGPAPGEEFGQRRRPKDSDVDRAAAAAVVGVAGAITDSARKSERTSQAQGGNNRAIDAECNKPFVPPPSEGGGVMTIAMRQPGETEASYNARVYEKDRYNEQQKAAAQRSAERLREAKADYNETQSLCKQRRILGAGQ